MTTGTLTTKLVESLPLPAGTTLSILCGGTHFSSDRDQPWLNVIVQGKTGEVDRNGMPNPDGLEIHHPDREVEALVSRFRLQHDWELPGNHSVVLKHPCGLALASDIQHWMMEQLGAPNAYWALMIAAGTYWFDAPQQYVTVAGKHLSLQFQFAGNLGATGDPGYEAINTAYSKWRIGQNERAKAWGLKQ